MIEITEYIDYFFVFLVLVFGAIITKGDLSRGKIRNAVIGAGLIAGLFGYIAVVAWVYATRSDASLSYFFDVGVNFLISILCGYLLWHYKLWAAGDAKFFILLSFLVPLRFYENGYFPYFPSSALVINIFIPIFLFLIARVFVDIMINFRKFLTDEIGAIGVQYAKMQRELVSIAKHKKRIFIFSWTFLLTFLFIPLLKYQTILALSPSFSVVLLIFIIFYFFQSYSYIVITVFLKKRRFVNGVSLCIGGYFIFGLYYFPDLLLSALMITIKVGVTFFIILAVFEKFSTFYIQRKEIVVVKANDLKPKMVISEELMEAIKNDAIFSQTLGELYPEGISREQVVLLKEWLKERGKEHIPVYKTFSFAPYIFAGVIITIILKQSVVHLFLSFIHS